MKIHQKTNRKSLKIILALLAVLLLVAGGWSIYAYSERQWPFADSETSEYSETGSPQTPEQEAEESQDAKKNNDKSEGSVPETDEAGRTIVVVGVAYADISDNILEIRAFTPSVIEGDGICTASLTKDGQTITASEPSFVDSTTSQCQPIQINTSQFSQSGTWDLVVAYSSTSSKGTSGVTKVTIP